MIRQLPGKLEKEVLVGKCFCAALISLWSLHGPELRVTMHAGAGTDFPKAAERRSTSRFSTVLSLLYSPTVWLAAYCPRPTSPLPSSSPRQFQNDKKPSFLGFPIVFFIAGCFTSILLQPSRRKEQ